MANVKLYTILSHIFALAVTVSEILTTNLRKRELELLRTAKKMVLVAACVRGKGKAEMLCLDILVSIKFDCC